MTMLEVDFKSNSIPQNQLKRWGLYLISSRCGTSNSCKL